MDFLVHHLLRSSTAKDGSIECIVHRNERLSYAQLDLLTNRLADGMLEAGLKRGDRVGVFLEKSINEVVSLFAISKAGGVFVPINQLLFPEQVGHILNVIRVKGPGRLVGQQNGRAIDHGPDYGSTLTLTS